MASPVNSTKHLRDNANLTPNLTENRKPSDPLSETSIALDSKKFSNSSTEIKIAGHSLSLLLMQNV